VYQIENSQVVLRARLRSRLRTRPVARNVVLLGLVSLLTDVSSEMVSTVLPLYLVVSLGVSPLGFGVIDGLYQGSSALVRLASGLVSDRWRRHKEVAATGYGLSAITKLGMLAVGSATGGIAALIMVDRTGKGIRTAPRDAMISLSCSPAAVGTAFGVHRAMDTAGAMLGPLIAFGLLSAAPGAFDAIFVVSFCFALLGLAVLVAFVDGRPRQAEPEPEAPVSLADAGRLLAAPAFRRLVVVGGALGLATISDGFLYLGLQRKIDFDTALFPLLFVGTAAAYMLLAVPLGKLADRIGRVRVFIGGYLLLLVAYTSLLLPHLGSAALVLYLIAFGAYYAATDGVLMAAGSGLLAPELRGTGMGMLVTSTSLGRLGGSVIFGALWAWAGLETAVLVFGAALALAIVTAAVALRQARPAVR
jgi:MFS family permease